jgi:hypothetical protein
VTSSTDSGATHAATDASMRKSRWGLHLALLAAGADLSGIDVGGTSVRLAWVLLPVAAFMIRRSRVDMYWLLATLLLVTIHVLASIGSMAPLRGIVYSGWIIFNYILLFRPGINAARQLGSEVWQVVIVSGRIQIIGGLLLVAAGVHDRAQFLYYESSYMAIGLIPYVFASIYLSRRRALDIGLIVVLLASNQSASLALVLIVAFVGWLVREGLSWQSVSVIAAVPLFAVGMAMRALSDPLSANYNIVKYLVDNGINWELVKVALERGGNRVPRIEAAWRIAQEFPLLGIGPGNYVDFSLSRNFSDLSGGLAALDPSGVPAVNVVVEACTNAGVIASAILIVVFLYMLRRTLKLRDGGVRRTVLGILFATAITLQFESNYLRAYVWLSFGLCAAQFTSRRKRSPRMLIAAPAAPPASAADNRPEAVPSH